MQGKDNEMKTINGSAIEISGWTQYAGDGIKELSSLEIKIGDAEAIVRLDISSDDLVAWCEKHEHPCKDMRNKHTGAA